MDPGCLSHFYIGPNANGMGFYQADYGIARFETEIVDGLLGNLGGDALTRININKPTTFRFGDIEDSAGKRVPYAQACRVTAA